jgi:co-chaperonin GroES (HSP10)
MLNKNFRLNTDWIIVNIELPENVGGLKVINRDPRKQARKPDAYVGDVVECGPRCKYVKVGDKVVFQRWQYSQFDVDDAHIALREVDLLTINQQCAPNYIAVQIYDPFRTTKVILPDEVKHSMDQSKVLFGKVISVGQEQKNKETADVREEDFIWFYRMTDDQFRIGNNTVVIRNDYDVILMSGALQKSPELAVI